METPSSHLVFAHVVTFNNETTIIPCLESVLAQQGFTLWKNLFLYVTDNSSSDKTVQFVSTHFADRVRLKTNSLNMGFTGAHNSAISFALSCNAQYVLLLNPDARLEADALGHLLAALDFDPRAGTACPKLLRADAQLNPVSPSVMDGAGMFITPAIRHFDRGSQESDLGQYEKEEYVFGASGAAILMSRAFILDAARKISGPDKQLRLFDDTFFAYREDADLAWRGQWLGWKCRYVPSAVGYHQRRVLPANRKALAVELNAYSVRNRFLLQFNNFSFWANLHCLPWQTFRNLLVVAAACTVERSSYPALRAAFVLAPQALRKRRILLDEARVSSSDMARWFSFKPHSEPALTERPASKKIRSLLAVVVNFNSGPRLGDCLNSLSPALHEIIQDMPIKVSVVDNGSDDLSAKRVEPMFRGTGLFSFEMSPSNLGFAGAINSAVRKDESDAVLVLNPDVHVSAESIRLLVSALDSHDTLGAIAPVLIGKDEKVQFGFTARSLPTLGSTLAELFYLHRLLPDNRWTRRYQLKDDIFVNQYLTRSPADQGSPYEHLDRPLVVPQPPAACLLIRKSAFDAVGGFDHCFWPAWFEDVDFAKRLQAKGFVCAVLSKAAANHEGGYSVQTLEPGRFSEIWYPNLRRYWAKHGTKLEYICFRCALPLALFMRSAVAFFDGIFPGRQTKKQAAEKLSNSQSLFRLAVKSLV
jgi:GT2 family glycosyltransferase